MRQHSSLYITLNILDVVHRCRNRGGHDFTWCSTKQETTIPFHSVCGTRKPERSYCLLVALKPYFTFTDYRYFTASSAQTICNEIGGIVPKLEKVSDWSRMASTMNYLQNHVRMGWPFSLRWMSWPVSPIFL